MRLIELFDAQGDEVGARDMLMSWIERDARTQPRLDDARHGPGSQAMGRRRLACAHLVALSWGRASG